MFYSTAILSSLVATALAVPTVNKVRAAATVNCPILLDGRVPAKTPVSTFNTANGIFNPDYVKGNNLTWSQILLTPNVTCPSRFDGSTKEAIEVTIDDRSIFQEQNGFRRAGLQFAADTSAEESTSRIVTLHWSVKQDPSRPLNLTHEYLNVWHEASDYSANQFNFNTGTRIGTDGSDKQTWQLLGRASNLLWETPINFTQWQNFAVTIDYAGNTLTVYTSTGNAPLVKAGGPFTNDNSLAGEFQIGILKKPTGSADVVNSGFQESPFSEGQIYGGLFVEDGAGGCITL